MKNTHKAGLIYIPDSRDNFHTYTVDWTPYELDFYVDDYLYFTYDNDGSGPASWPYDKDFYLIVCLAIGGEWGAQQGIDDSALPAALEVDWVRVYDSPVESQDVEQPAIVSDLSIDVKGTLATVQWPHGQDDYLVDHYEVYLDDEMVSETADRDVTFYTLDELTGYSVGVVAVDIGGNSSDLVTTPFMTESEGAQGIGEIIQGEAALVNMGGQLREVDGRTIVEYLDPGDYLIYELDIPKEGKYDLTITLSSLMSKGSVSILVDGLPVKERVALPANAGWENFEDVDLGSMTLEEGRRFLTLLTEKSGYAVDSIQLK